MFGACLSNGGGMEPSEWHEATYEVVSQCECIECKEAIEYGEKCHLVAAAYEDNWTVYITCETCKRIRDSLFNDYMFGEMWNDINELYGLTCSDKEPVDETWDDDEEQSYDALWCNKCNRIEQRRNPLWHYRNVDDCDGIRVWYCPSCNHVDLVNEGDSFALYWWDSTYEYCEKNYPFPITEEKPVPHDAHIKLHEGYLRDKENGPLEEKVVLSDSLQNELGEHDLS